MSSEQDRIIAARQKERDTLIANEIFVIGVLQAVSGGSIVAGLAQYQPIYSLVGKFPFLAFLTLMTLALACAVLAAYWKHQYKLFDIKWLIRMESNLPEEALRLRVLTDLYLNLMRWAMLISVSSIAISLFGLIIAFWSH